MGFNSVFKGLNTHTRKSTYRYTLLIRYFSIVYKYTNERVINLYLILQLKQLFVKYVI
jgi:hypothetical protein